MRNIKVVVPNSLTAINLLCGAIASVLLFRGFIIEPVYLIIIAAIADLLDGLVAKLLGATSEFGKQFDSLADIISFGFAPSIFLYKSVLLVTDNKYSLIAYLVFIYLLFSALRLARYNIEENKTPDFKGLPVPAGALVIVSIWITIHYSDIEWLKSVVSPGFILVSTILLSSLMISSLPMLSLKFKNFKLSENIWRYTLIIGVLVLYVFFKLSGLVFIMGYYILLSFIKYTINSSN